MSGTTTWNGRKNFSASNLKSHDNFQAKEYPQKEKSHGLPEYEVWFKKGVIKGRIAETLIEELFLSLGYKVFRYGVENTLPGILGLLKGVKSDVATSIRKMPDFVVQKNNGEVYFIEVKFRANENFNIRDLPHDYPYTSCYFIVVSKKHIKCITYKELKQGEKITPESDNYLDKRQEFALDTEAIKKFREFAVKFFKEV